MQGSHPFVCQQLPPQMAASPGRSASAACRPNPSPVALILTKLRMRNRWQTSCRLCAWLHKAHACCCTLGALQRGQLVCLYPRQATSRYAACRQAARRQVRVGSPGSAGAAVRHPAYPSGARSAGLEWQPEYPLEQRLHLAAWAPLQQQHLGCHTQHA